MAHSLFSGRLLLLGLLVPSTLVDGAIVLPYPRVWAATAGACRLSGGHRLDLRPLPIGPPVPRGFSQGLRRLWICSAPARQASRPAWAKGPQRDAGRQASEPSRARRADRRRQPLAHEAQPAGRFL